ncbi:hypothetical protein RFI_11870, partial [Reticulomyxa filosa]
MYMCCNIEYPYKHAIKDKESGNKPQLGDKKMHGENETLPLYNGLRDDSRNSPLSRYDVSNDNDNDNSDPSPTSKPPIIDRPLYGNANHNEEEDGDKGDDERSIITKEDRSSSNSPTVPAMDPSMFGSPPEEEKEENNHDNDNTNDNVITDAKVVTIDRQRFSSDNNETVESVISLSETWMDESSIALQKKANETESEPVTAIANDEDSPPPPMTPKWETFAPLP